MDFCCAEDAMLHRRDYGTDGKKGTGGRTSAVSVCSVFSVCSVISSSLFEYFRIARPSMRPTHIRDRAHASPTEAESCLLRAPRGSTRGPPGYPSPPENAWP